MRRAIISLLVFSAPLLRADTAQNRLKDTTQVFQEIMATPDKGIPRNLLEKAHCLVIVPGLKEAAFVVGGKYGRGFVLCRHASDGWGAPSAVRVEGGSFGFQIGASSTDVVMLIMNERGMRRLLEDHFTLGADATVAAGPVGRSTSAQTDAQLTAEILSWSRAKGLFAGIALTGATLRNDNDENKALYDHPYTSKEILTTKVKPPAEALPLVAQLNRYSRYEAKDKPIETRAQHAIAGSADRSKTQK